MRDEQYKGPLAGLNVIDFGHYYAGPMAAVLLADQGANVIHIVRPGEPELKPQQYRLLNRNKKLIELDIKSAEGQQKALSLIKRADVVIENFRPGVMKKLGLDYASLKNLNPGLVYLSLPGFASTDKKRSHIQAWENVVAAAAGMYTECHLFRQKLGFPPVYTWVPLCSAFASMHGAIAVMAALVGREEYGTGTVIEVPLVEAGLSLFPDQFLVRSSGSFKDPWAPFRTQVEGEIKRPKEYEHLAYQRGDSEEVQYHKLERAHDEMQPPYFYQLYPTADDRLVLTHTAGNPAFAEAYFTVLGIYEQLRAEGYINEIPRGVDHGNNLSSGYMLTPEKRQRLIELTTQAMRQKTGDEWEELFEKHGVPGNYIRTRDEWLSLEPMIKSGVLTKMQGEASELTVPGRVVDVSGPGGSVMDILPDEPIWTDYETALDLFGKDRSINAPHGVQPLKKGDLLKGLKVLDLANVVAGPTSSYTLAQYGADVIKADPPTYPAGMLKMCIHLNQGKRSILTDVHSAPGREVLQRLLGWSDVVVHNILDDTAKRLGVAHSQLEKLKPGIVSCQLTAFGGSHRGYWENRKGFDPLAQNASGVMVGYGTMEYPQDHGSLSADIMGGISLAFSALLGVYQQRKTGYGGETRASLARAISYVQFPGMIRENGNSYWGEPTGQMALGSNWWDRLYQCADAWIYVCATAGQKLLLSQIIIGTETCATEQLETAFLSKSSGHWLQRISEKGIACHKVITVDDFCAETDIKAVPATTSDETVSENIDVLRWDDHPFDIPMVLLAPAWVRVGENHSYKRLTPAPKLGEHTAEILADLGYDDNDVQELIRLKISYAHLPMHKRQR